MSEHAWQEVYAAVRFGEHDLYEESIEAADIHETTRDGSSLLHIAAANGHVDMAEDLIDRGINVNYVGYEGKTPLHFAVRRGQTAVVKVLLDNGADTATVDNYGNQPLWHAVNNPDRSEQVVRLLLEYGADPNQKNDRDDSPLDVAREREYSDLVSLLSKSSSRGSPSDRGRSHE